MKLSSLLGRNTFPILPIALLLALLTSTALAQPDWSLNATIPPEGRTNPFDLSPDAYQQSLFNGKLSTLQYPVTVTASLVPYDALNKFLSESDDGLIKTLIKKTFKKVTDFKSIDDIGREMGLHKFPNEYPTPTPPFESPYYFPPNPNADEGLRIGMSLHTRQTPEGPARGMTFSCAACHSAQLFGRPVLGLGNRFPRANELFVSGRKAVNLVTPSLFEWATQPSAAEALLFSGLRQAMRSVNAVTPQAPGLDTSLAQVALSLARRAPDEYAELSPWYQTFPRAEKLQTQVADSKPAPWWNLKYKTRWLLDGSVVSGNPIFTNFLWNEIGRGTDLHALEQWLRQNTSVIEDLTTAVFSTQAPRYVDFFGPNSIDSKKARRGEGIFNQHCAACHGTYSLSASNLVPDGINKVSVKYPTPTPVIEIGTDPLRAQGMTSLATGLNQLKISKQNGITIQPQRGYVPPPLVGIWARWPYFHNNSVPTLCDVISQATHRPKQFWMREANDPQIDFDSECNGYPTQTTALAAPPYLYDTTRPGMSNAGHDGWNFSKTEKLALVEYLKTL